MSKVKYGLLQKVDYPKGIHAARSAPSAGDRPTLHLCTADKSNPSEQQIVIYIILFIILNQKATRMGNVTNLK